MFSREGIEDIPTAKNMFGGSKEDMLGGIDITQEMVTKQLSRLRDDKASGPDELVPRFLNEIREGIRKLERWMNGWMDGYTHYSADRPAALKYRPVCSMIFTQNGVTKYSR